MSDNKPQGNFMDPKTITAIVLVGAVFFGWQSYLGKKYPDYYKPKPKEAAVEAAKPVENSATGTTAATTAAPAPSTSDVLAKEPSKIPFQPAGPEQTLAYENGLFSFQLSSHGMGLKNLTSKEFLDRQQQPVRFGDVKMAPQFATRLLGQDQPIEFQLSQAGEHSFVGVAKLGETTIKKTMMIDPVSGKIETEVMIEKPGAGFKGVATRFVEHKIVVKSGTGFLSFLMPSMEHQEFVIRKEGKAERVRADSQTEDHVQTFTNATMAAIGSQFFVSAYADHSDILPNIEIIAPKEQALAEGKTEDQRELAFVSVDVQYKPVNVSDRLQLKSTVYVGGKSVTRLELADPEFSDVVNLGMFGMIGKVLLKILKWSYAMTGNWGWAIVILTLLVRALVAPFNISSYKSMKKMSNIQPLLKSLRERYKDDPAALNRESMALMKEHKVNPMGSCLPMLLQMPIFFALYQVLGQSIELYQAPFVLWIHDLSLKDPYYILPVLMGIVMYLQQKLTPTATMDPNQAKVLQWMPVIFSVFMLGLPSGLTLYIFVSTAFSVIQQRLFMRDRTKAPAFIDAKAQRVH